MKNIIKNSMQITILAVISALVFSSCSDWVKYESLEIKTPSFEEQNPELYAEYIKNLKAYKARTHKVVFVTFENKADKPGKRAEHLTTLPDSIDYISLLNPDVLHPVIVDEIGKVRDKGTKVIYDINYSVFDAQWQAIVKDDKEGELTEENALAYIAKRTNEMLTLCDKHSYDGITFTYVGRSHVSLTEAEAVIYSGRQKAFFDLLTAWRTGNANKSFSYIGNPQYLDDENKTILTKCDYIILMTDMLRNESDISIKASLAIASGNVPSDRFVATVHAAPVDDDDMLYGYFGTLDENGNPMRSIIGAALWAGMPSDFTRSGVLIRNAHYDYYDNKPVYNNIRQAIGIMNPSPKN